MKLRRLDLKAFGPFTDRSLEFDSRQPGLHIIFGSNEAGKSSSLRALKALLYGFPPQTPDNFLHSYDQLLVGGCLENSAGDEIVCYRRKKRINDLVDEYDNPLDPNALAPFLHGVEPEIFESLYGIDHYRLVQGGHEILAQKGEVGQALFAAGAGISSLKAVIDLLEKEALDLFKSAGQLPKINKAINRFKVLQKEVREAYLSTKDWKDHQKALHNAEIERVGLERDRDLKNKELRHLERLRQAIPELASLKAWHDQLQALGDVVFLPPDFKERHQQIVQEIREVKEKLERDSDRLRQIEEKRKAISVNRGFLEQADMIDDFHQRLGEYRKGLKDRPVRDGMRISLRKEAAGLLKQLRPDLPLEEIETLRPVLAKKRTILTLSAQFEAINEQLNQAKKQSSAAAQEIREVEEVLAAMPGAMDQRGLLQAIKMAQKAGDVDIQLEKNRRELEQDNADCSTELKRIGCWKGDLAALMELPLPRSETLQQFEKDFSEVAVERRELEKGRKNAEKELQNVRAEIRKIEFAGKVPSEEALLGIRKKREEGWQLLRRKWLDNEDVVEESHNYDPEKPLPEAYERFVGQADLLADRLRREAERVANVAAFRAQTENLQDSLAENNRLMESLEQRERELFAGWARVWKPVEIDPLSPKEMRGWLAEMEKLRYRVSCLVKKEQEIKGEMRRRQDLRQKLLKELKAMGETEIPAGDTLGPVLVLAETVSEGIAGRNMALEKLMDRQKKARNTFGQAEEELKAARKGFVVWQAQWKKALSGLGLQEEISTLEATDAIEVLQNCLDKVNEADDLKKRIAGIDRDAGNLEKEVRELSEKAAPDLKALPLDQAILQLRARLGQAQKDGTLHDKLSEEFDILQAEVSAAGKTLQSAEEQMSELLRVAQREKPEELAAVIGRFGEYQRLQEKISDTEAILAKIGAGVPIDELARQATEINADELPGKIEFLRNSIEERINPEINRISQVIGEETARLAVMNGSPRAAELTEKMEQELAGIRRLTERYALVKLASKILQQEIERYREEHQDPVLKIASRYFAELTLSSFAGLRTDVDDKNEPVLIGIRQDGKRVGVEGMSDGTRDQLYLALRLATLEWRLETSEPLPFIVDDILINFDDERAKATLAALADLAEKNQVILFTHHRQIVHEAAQIQDTKPVFVYEL